MKKLEYLKLCLANNTIHEFHWVITAFSITKEDKNKSNYKYKLITKPDGLYFTTGNAEEKIEDHIPGQALFSFKERVMADSSFISNCSGTVDTTMGNILFNALAIIYPFGTKIPFQTKVNPKKIEELVINNLRDTVPDEEKDANYFYVDELEKFSLAVAFIENLASLVSISATSKNIRKAPGINEFKQQLLKGYGESIKQPTVLDEYERKLKAYDEDWLKDDPSNNKFLAGKAKNIGRKKMFDTISASNTFEESPEKHVIGNSLDEGYPLNKPDLVAGFEDSRVGSYGRAVGTKLGGVAAKYLARATNTYTITEDDCGSIIGLPRTVTKDNYKLLVGRSYIKGLNVVKIDTEATASSLLGERLILRSPLYCKTQGTHICTVCAGDKLNNYKEGLFSSVLEISDWILNENLKRMHKGVTTSTTKLDISTAFS